jgi:hypothetical protein
MTRTASGCHEVLNRNSCNYNLFDIALGKDDEDILRSQYEYHGNQQGFNDDHPYVAGGPHVLSLMERWFDQLIKWSRRDQAAFNYARSLCPEVTVNYIPYYLWVPCKIRIFVQNQGASENFTAGI